jgi:hypothetical protein
MYLDSRRKQKTFHHSKLSKPALRHTQPSTDWERGPFYPAPIEQCTAYIFFHGATALVGQDLIIEATRSHSDTPHSVGLLWTSDQPVAETSTWQHTKHTTDIHAPRGIRTQNPRKQAAADSRLTPHGHWDGHTVHTRARARLCKKNWLRVHLKRSMNWGNFQRIYF